MAYLLYCLIFIRLSYWVLIFSKLARFQSTGALNRIEGVSVVVCVKNNIEGLKVLLSKLLKQNHQKYEVVIVDDFSTDGVEGFIKLNDSPLIKYCRPDKDVAGKKMALSKGIDLAKHEWILVTDSDCIPSSLDWISLMVGKAVDEQKEIVLGYGPIDGHGLIGQLAKYEAAYVAMQYLSYALIGKPYMGVGRNMLYRKKLFVDSQPFASNIEVASGDDDMFVQKAATSSNTTICIDANAQCKSTSPANVKGYIRQKIRHTSTSTLYDNRTKYMLGIFGAVHLLIYLIIIVGPMTGLLNLSTTLSLWLLMCGVMVIVQYACFAKLSEHKLILNLFVSDILLSLLYSIVGFKTMTNNNKGWN
jgi:cellulose synthase/poly-beta-1,6-N-acetylglucosamine synthase-like glycosyltransferase